MTPQGLSALKPCPFCGQAPSLRTFETESLFSHAIVPWLSIKCDACDCAQIEGEQFDEVRIAWNTRSEGPQPPAVKVDEGVREAAARIVDPWPFGVMANIAHTERAAADRKAAFGKVDRILSLLGPTTP